MLDQLGRLIRTGSRSHLPPCIVCRRPIRGNDRSMTVRGSVQAHQGCATYRMRQVDHGAARIDYPPRRRRRPDDAER